MISFYYISTNTVLIVIDGNRLRTSVLHINRSIDCRLHRCKEVGRQSRRWRTIQASGVAASNQLTMILLMICRNIFEKQQLI